MKWTTVKKDNEVKLDGLAVELDFQDKQLKTVSLTDARGNKLQIASDGYYSLVARVPAPPEMVERWKLSGRFLSSLDINEVFDSEHEALTRKSELNKAAGYPDELGLQIEKVSVPEA